MNLIATVVVVLWVARDIFTVLAQRSMSMKGVDFIVEKRLTEEKGKAFVVGMTVSRWSFEVALFVLIWKALS